MITNRPFGKQKQNEKGHHFKTVHLIFENFWQCCLGYKVINILSFSFLPQVIKKEMYAKTDDLLKNRRHFEMTMIWLNF